MTSPTEMEIYRSHRAAQERYVYFMLAATGAAIAFAVTRTQDMPLTWSQVPLASAVMSWGVSFFAGCMNVRYVESNLFANLELLRAESGRHPKVGSHPQLIQAASDGIRDAMESNSNRARNYAFLQFYGLAAGAVFFIAWHLLEMYLRT